MKRRHLRAGKLEHAQNEFREIANEERKNEKVRSDFLGFVHDLDSKSAGPDERAAETDPEHPIAEC